MSPCSISLSLQPARYEVVAPQTRSFDGPEARCSRPKIGKSRSSPDNASAPTAILDPKKQKARQTLTGLSGYLAEARPASSMLRQNRERFSPHDGKKLITFHTVLQ